jgi:hypothetical protein
VLDALERALESTSAHAVPADGLQFLQLEPVIWSEPRAVAGKFGRVHELESSLPGMKAP